MTTCIHVERRRVRWTSSRAIILCEGLLLSVVCGGCIYKELLTGFC